MEKQAIGLVELNSIAAGFDVADNMLKTSDVELLLSRSICSGKYMVLVAGSVAAVEMSVESGVNRWEGAVIDSMVIPNVHESLFAAIGGSNQVKELQALGVLESFSIASLIQAADAAVKSANVQLLEVRLAMALGGKAFATLTGDVSSVQTAVDIGADVIGQKGLLVNKVVIAKPNPDLYKHII